jgi:hypothetical protein
MTTPHIPNLNAIRALPNPEIKFYAIIGAVMSLGAGLELAYFDIFEKATRLDQKMAASIFYKVRNTGTRREIADTAMRLALDGRQELTEWNALSKRIVTVTGGSGERNLAGHSVVTKGMTETLTPTGFGGDHDPYEQVYNPRRTLVGTDDSWALGRVILQEARYYISQDQIQIMAGSQNPRDADFESLFATCNTVIRVLTDLEALLNRLE